MKIIYLLLVVLVSYVQTDDYFLYTDRYDNYCGSNHTNEYTTPIDSFRQLLLRTRYMCKVPWNKEI